MVDNNGFKEVLLSDNEIADIIEGKCINNYGLKANQYLVVKRLDGEVAYKLRWNGERFINVTFNKLKSSFDNTLKPRNVGQELAFDLFRNKDAIIKCFTGVQGAGKDMLMSTFAYDEIMSGRKSHLVFIRNNVGVRHTHEIGHLPGESMDKMMPWAGMLCDHLGGENQVRCFIEDGIIEIIPLCHLRGRDIRNAIVYVTEAENLTTDHMQLIMGRCSDNTELWVNGSFEQIDKKIFEEDNGLRAMIEKLSGHNEFGHVHLEKTERGRIAELSEELES